MEIRRQLRLISPRAGHDKLGAPFVTAVIGMIYLKKSPVKAAIRNIVASAKIAKAFDSAFVAFLQPSLLTKANPSKAESAFLASFTARTERRLGVGDADWDRHDEFIRNLINQRLADSQVPGLRFVDMSTEFDGVEKSTYTDLIHAEQHANVLLAESIFRILREIVAADTG